MNSDIKDRHCPGLLDGLHRGHMAVIEKAVRQKRTVSGQYAVTFKEHPQKYLNGSTPP